MQCLPAGEDMSFNWSGLEQVGMWRICGASPPRYCFVSRVTMPGTYTLEICAYAEIEGGQPDADAPLRLVGASPAGDCRRLEVEFRQPTSTPVIIRFDE